jgi:hypothetical protein
LHTLLASIAKHPRHPKLNSASHPELDSGPTLHTLLASIAKHLVTLNLTPRHPELDSGSTWYTLLASITVHSLH